MARTERVRRKKRKTKTMSNTSKSSSDFPTPKNPPTPMQMAGKSTEKSQQKVPAKKYKCSREAQGPKTMAVKK